MSSSADSVSESYTDLAHKIDPRHIKVPDPRGEDAKVIAKYPWNGGEHENGRLAWGEQHGIHSEFLPFAYLADDPIRVMTTVAEFLDSRPPTKQRVSTSELYSRANLSRKSPGPWVFENICLLHGWWHGGEASASGPYYCNPDYVHSHDESDYCEREVYWDAEKGEYVSERFEFAKKATAYGLSAPVAARAFGLKNRNTPQWLLDRGFSWDHEREKGLEKMARTCKTIHSWGYTLFEIAAAFGLPRSTVGDRIRMYAADFEPPADPSYRVIKRGEL